MILITNKMVHTSILMHMCAYIVCVLMCTGLCACGVLFYWRIAAISWN